MSAEIDPADFELTADQLDAKYNPEGGGEHPRFTRADWRFEVSEGNTLRGYWDWVEAELDATEDSPLEDDDDKEGACARCDSPLNKDCLCTDETCPFSDYQQDDARGWVGHPEKESKEDAS